METLQQRIATAQTVLDWITGFATGAISYGIRYQRAGYTVRPLAPPSQGEGGLPGGLHTRAYQRTELLAWAGYGMTMWNDWRPPTMGRSRSPMSLADPYNSWGMPSAKRGGRSVFQMREA